MAQALRVRRVAGADVAWGALMSWEIVASALLGVLTAGSVYLWKERRARIIKIISSLEAARARIRLFAGVYEREPLEIPAALVEIEKAIANEIAG